MIFSYYVIDVRYVIGFYFQFFKIENKRIAHKDMYTNTILMSVSLRNKINQRINDMFENKDIDHDFLNISVKKNIEEKLLVYQSFHVHTMLSSLLRNNCIIDGSNTGTGKTYCSIACAKQLGMQPFIICPKSIMSTWKKVCDEFNVVPFCIINYDMIKNGNIMSNDNSKEKADFLSIKKEKNDDFENKNKNISFEWKFNNPKKIIFIIDEAHKCKNKNSINGKLLLSLKNISKIMLLSATICDKLSDFSVFGYMLNFYNNIKKSNNWIHGIEIEEKSQLKKTNVLTKYLYPEKGSKMSISDIPDFPENQIICECFDLDETVLNKINSQYDMLKKMSGIDTIVEMNKCRERIEIEKKYIFINLIDKYLDHGKSVVVFVNYTGTFKELSKHYREKASYICGTQTSTDRDVNINNFQNNNKRIMISMIQAGGQSINLHDLNGKYPRVSIISPSFSSIEIIQAIGRIHRSGAKSYALNILVFCSKTIEELIYEKVKKKTKFINKLSDEDLITIN